MSERETIPSKHALILNRLCEMQRAPYYATAREELALAESTILQLERELSHAQSCDARRFIDETRIQAEAPLPGPSDPPATDQAEREDMESIGRALMETLSINLPHYSWLHCPSEVVVDLINERDEALTAAPKPQDDVWKPIATAPFGESVLCYWPAIKRNDVKRESYQAQAWCRFGNWFLTRDGYGAPSNDVNEPTHWMPLLCPPQPKEGSHE